MSDIAIRCESLSKRYRIGERESYKALRDVLTDAAKAPIRRLRSAISNGNGSAIRHSQSEIRNSFLALDHVSFDIKRGEVVGVIGRNGAGKSTLLKILSRITKPTSGQAVICGRVGSLLEVGTGFHPELSGRENIYLNGAILGMRKADIERKFDDIVAFAEVERFIDTPVKRYSSGMYVRLAFGVAAHLEPDILLVDEVLAVGDAEFQKKCLGKMDSVAKQGRTVIVVSHNMGLISQLCDRTILLNEGKVVSQGQTHEVVAEYLRTNTESGGLREWNDPATAPGNKKIRLAALRLVSNESVTGDVDIDKEVAIEVDFWNLLDDSRNLCVNIYLLDGLGNTVLSTGNTTAANSLPDDWFTQAHPAGLFRAVCTLPGNFLNDGLYYVSVYVVSLGPIQIEATAEQALSFNVHDTGAMREAGGGEDWHGVVRMRLPWRTQQLNTLPSKMAKV
jgi:lipopolysaccharide transport system ATP-binding protein